MQFDRKSLEQMLALDDEALRRLIERLARESGINPALLKLGPGDLGALRAAIGSASDAELSRIGEKIAERKGGGSGHEQ